MKYLEKKNQVNYVQKLTEEKMNVTEEMKTNLNKLKNHTRKDLVLLHSKFFHKFF